MGKIDVYGMSVRAAAHERNHDHFAIATLSKSMRVHQTNLSIDDDSRVHGHNQGQLYLVADGIRAGRAPARASRAAVDGVVRYLLNEMPWYHLADGAPADVELALADAVQDSRESIAANVNGDAGTTMTLALVFWPDLYLAHVGDSRCYLHRGGALRRLTTDHTPASGRQRALPATSAAGALGIEPRVRHLELRSGDTLALVTDGVVEAGPERALEAILDMEATAEEVCARLVAGSGPREDDRTAIVVRYLPPRAQPAARSSIPTPPPLEQQHERPDVRSKPGSRSRTTSTREVRRMSHPPRTGDANNPSERTPGSLSHPWAKGTQTASFPHQ